MPGLFWAIAPTSSIIGQSLPDEEENIKFYCDIDAEGVPTTFVRTTRGNITLIRWFSRHFSSSGYTPQQRCEKVSSRFQRAYENGSLKYLTVGTIYSLPVICAVESMDIPCDTSNILFTFTPGEDPNQVLRELSSRFTIEPIENKDVVCLSRNEDGLCNGLLLTLDPDIESIDL